MTADAEDHGAIDGAGQFFEALVVFPAEVGAVAFGLPIRRIAVEERVRPVVLFDDLVPGQMLDGGTGEAVVGIGEILFEGEDVEAGATGGGGAEGLAVDLAAEGELLQVEKAGGALYVGEGFGRGGLQPLPVLPTG